MSMFRLSESFQKYYILVPADKASNNIIVVCKKYYVEVVLNEFPMLVNHLHIKLVTIVLIICDPPWEKGPFVVVNVF